MPPIATRASRALRFGVLSQLRPQLLQTLVNFMVTEDGLEDQLLATVVQLERPDLAEQKDQLISQQVPIACIYSMIRHTFFLVRFAQLACVIHALSE